MDGLPLRARTNPVEAGRNIEKIKALLAHSFERAKPMLKNLRPEDIAKILSAVSPESQKAIISLLPADKASEAILEMPEESNAADLLASLSPEDAADIIEQLDPDDAADLLSHLPIEDLRLIFHELSDEVNRTLNVLMTYPEDSAGGLMNPDVLSIPAHYTKSQALAEVVRRTEEMEDFYAIYVVDEEGKLVGVVPLKALIRAHPMRQVSAIMTEDIVKVHVLDDQEVVARVLRDNNIPAVPVVDDDGRLLGRITFDDVMYVLEEEGTEDLLKMAGVSDSESLRGSWLEAVRSRLPWLMINLVTASLAGLVVSLFHNTLETLVVLASYMPVIAGVAGNGATQTLAVTIRRIATENVNAGEFWRVILKELSVGAFHGFVLGAVISLLAILLNQNPMLGLVVFLAMVGNLVVAGFSGSAVPLILQRFGVDPAVASSILITALTDIIGFTLLLTLGTLLLL